MPDTQHTPIPAGHRSSSREGIDRPVPLDAALSYVVPPGATAQPLYFRGGNSTDELICVVLCATATPMRYFPIGAEGADVHVPLRVVEDLVAGTVIEMFIAAPEGVSGTVIVDLGLVEV